MSNRTESQKPIATYVEESAGNHGTISLTFESNWSQKKKTKGKRWGLLDSLLIRREILFLRR